MTTQDPPRAAGAGRTIFGVSVILCAAVAIWGIADPDGLAAAGTAFQRTVLDALGWLFMGSVTAFLALGIWLAMSRYGRIKLGKEGDEPEFSTLSWLSMLFAAGMGVGLLFWGVAEPVIHYANPPVPPGETPTAARAAMVQTIFHWGFHAWAVYSVGGLVLAYFGFRRGQPYLPGAPLRSAFRGSWVGPLASAADLIGILAVAAGVAGSVGAGILQLHTGLSVATGVSPTSPLVPVLILLALVAAYMASATTGLDKGIKWLSNINMVTALLLLGFVLLAGPTSFLLDVFVTATGDYIAALPRLSLRLFPFRDLDSWTSSWTLTYFIWWIAWAPFVGVFIARISRGRTIREYIVGVTLAPTLFSILWFAVFGGTGIHEELHGAGGVTQLVNEDVTSALFALYERIPLTALLSGVTIALLFVFLVTSCDSATFVLGMLSSGGALVPPTSRKLIWGVVIAVMGAALMLTGNIEVLKAVVVTGAVPFTFIMLLQVVALLRALRGEVVPPRRKRKRAGAGAAVVLLLFAPPLLSGCGSGETPVRIGVKSFAEQEILGQMAVQLCADAEFPTAPLVVCGDTYGCQEGLRNGTLDAMVEYSGTALIFAGEDLADGDASVGRARALYRDWDLEWLEPLGLDNGYRLALRSDRALSLQVATIADLALLDTDLRITCPAEYLRRSADGLPALTRRHGLRVATDPLVREDPAGRRQALLDGRADVAVLYATDGVMADGRLTVLEDSLGFFPLYEAAFVARRDALTRHPQLLETLSTLSGQVDDGAMQRLNHAVQEEGRTPEVVAREFLEARELLQEETAVGSRGGGLELAVQGHGELDDFSATAVRAIRDVYPERSVEVSPSYGAALDVVEGRARLAVLGAEGFFPVADDGEIFRDERIEAVAVLGSSYLHVIRRAGPRGGAPFSGQVGITAGSGWRVAEDVVRAAGGQVACRRWPSELLATLSEGGIDGALLVAPLGDPQITRALRDDGLVLADLDGWMTPERAAALPYLRPARIPAQTYAGQAEPTGTLGQQILLVGPAPASTPMGQAGPASALASSAQPLSRETALALADAAGGMEAPDPALPSAWRRIPPGDGRGGAEAPSTPPSTSSPSPSSAGSPGSRSGRADPLLATTSPGRVDFRKNLVFSFR